MNKTTTRFEGRRTQILFSIVLAILLMPFSGFAQKYVEMMEDETVNFYDVQREADKYFDSVGTGKGNGYKQYKRWEYETSLQIDEYGNRISKLQIEEETQKARLRNQSKRFKTAEGTLAITWTEVGPLSKNATSGWNPGVGRVTAIAVEPVNQQLIYAGTPEGGLWKSTNGGSTWAPMFDQNNNMKIYSIALDPTNSNIVYVGTNGAGVYKSTNGGSSWTTNSFTTSKVGKIVIDPTNTSILIAATAGGIYRSTNAGSTWTRTGTYNTEDVEFKPGATSTMYATGSSCYRSTDNGVTWTQITNGITGTGRSLVAVTPANPSYVYIVQASGSSYGKTYKSTDSGVSFTVVNSGSSGSNNLFGYETNGTGTGGQATYDMALCVSPTNANEVHLAGIICWKSTNGGTSYTATTAWTWNNAIGYNHADVHVLEYVGNNIYSGSDGGIYKSTDKADNWTDLSQGLGIRMFYRMGVCKSNANVCSGGAQDNGTSVYNSGTWKDWLGADGMESFVDHTNPNILYGTSQNGSLYKSTNGGNTYSSMTKPESSGNWVTPFLMDPNVNTTLYAGYVQIYKSTNSGSSWTAISSFSGTDKANDIQIAASNSSYIYVIRGTSMYVTKNGGTSWTQLTASPSGNPNSIAIHPTNPEKVALATTTGKVYISTNAGGAWTNYSGTLPALSAYKVVFDNRTQEGIYVGLTRGVYYRDNTMSDWTPYIFNLPYAPVYDLEFHAQSNQIFAATHGRGLWKAPAYTSSTSNNLPTVSITAPTSGTTYTAPASITINATASDSDGSITKVEFYNGTTLLGSDNTSPYSFSWTNVAAGTYSITAKAYDNLNATATSTAVSVTVNSGTNQLPTVSITSPANNATFTAPASITINATASDADGTISKVEFYNGSTLLGSDNTSPYSFSWTNVAAGTYSITARAYDNLNATKTSTAITIVVNAGTGCTAPAWNASTIYLGDGGLGTGNGEVVSYNGRQYRALWWTQGNTPGTNSVWSDLGACTVANQLPTVSITSPANNATFTVPASITINATATDADGTISKVEFYNGTTLLGSDNTSPYSFSWTNVAAGTYSITAKAYDNVNAVTTSSVISITVNAPNQLPTVSITSPANNATFTAPASITINATATDADGTISKVEFYNGTTLLGSNNTSPYSFSWTNVAAGTYSITAKAFDNANASTTSAAITVIVNAPNQLPTVSITSPANNATFTAPASITINATATDADGTISKVEFYNGTTLLGSDNTSPYSFSWTNVAAGTYSITAKAYDNVNAVTTSFAISITVNAPNQLPTVSITSPANNATYTAPASITINATATDADGTISKVEFYNGTTLLGSDNTSPYSFSWTNVAAGTYSITAKAIDNANASTTSAAITVIVNAPNQLPTVSITSPANNATFTAPASITINATATDADGTISKVEFYNGTTLLGSDNTSPYSFSWTNVAAGTYSITAKAYDNVNAVTTSSAISITVNAPNQLPTVSITLPANNATFTAPASITINATATDADGTISKVEFYYGTTLLGSDNTSPYSFSWTNVAAGTYSITAKAYDNVNAVTTSSAISITVNAPNQLPTVSITSPANNATFTAPASITINATAMDADGAISKVEFYNGTTMLGSDNTSPYSYSWTNVAAGTYSITAKAIDNANASTTSAAITVIVNAPNQLPTVSITSPANNATFTAPASFIINATASDADGSISKVEFYNGTSLIGTDNTSPYSFSVSNVAGGTYSLTAKAYDNSGAVSTSAAVSIIVQSGTENCATIAPWNNLAVYVKDDLVTFNGFLYKAKWWTQNNSPALYSGQWDVWAKVGECISGTQASVIPVMSVVPAENANLNVSETLSLNVSGLSSGAITEVIYVIYKNEETKVSYSKTGPDYSAAWTALEDGDHLLQVIVKDENGMLIYSNAVTVKVSQVTGINSAWSNELIQVIPNPNTSRFRLSSSANVKLDGALIEMTDMTGKKVYEKVMKSGGEDIEHELKAGMYLLKITNGEKVIITKVQIN